MHISTGNAPFCVRMAIDGTGVASTYASMYPQNVERLMINGNMPFGPGSEEFVEEVCHRRPPLPCLVLERTTHAMGAHWVVLGVLA